MREKWFSLSFHIISENRVRDIFVRKLRWEYGNNTLLVAADSSAVILGDKGHTILVSRITCEGRLPKNQRFQQCGRFHLYSAGLLRCFFMLGLYSGFDGS